MGGVGGRGAGLKIIICLRKSEISVDICRASVYDVIERMTEHGIHCLPLGTTDVIYFTIATENLYLCLK